MQWEIYESTSTSIYGYITGGTGPYSLDFSTSLGEKKTPISNLLLYFNFLEEGENNSNICDARGTGKPLHYSTLDITMNHKCEMEVSSDHSDTKGAKCINDDDF